jgi:hypothetical protein
MAAPITHFYNLIKLISGEFSVIFLSELVVFLDFVEIYSFASKSHWTRRNSSFMMPPFRASTAVE